MSSTDYLEPAADHEWLVPTFAGEWPHPSPDRAGVELNCRLVIVVSWLAWDTLLNFDAEVSHYLDLSIKTA